MISVSLSLWHGTSSSCVCRNGLQTWKVAANISNKQSQIADNGWSSSLWVGRGASNSHCKNWTMLRNSHKSLWTGLIFRYNLISLAQDRDRWWALVSAVMNHQVPQNARNFLTTWELLAFQEQLCSMESVTWQWLGRNILIKLNIFDVYHNKSNVYSLWWN